jgi:hypothetical protein
MDGGARMEHSPEQEPGAGVPLDTGPCPRLSSSGTSPIHPLHSQQQARHQEDEESVLHQVVVQPGQP